MRLARSLVAESVEDLEVGQVVVLGLLEERWHQLCHPGRRSQRSFWIRRSSESSSRFIGFLVGDGRLSGIAGHRRWDELVVARQVGVAKLECVEHGIAEAQRRRRRREALLAAKHVLDVLGTHVVNSAIASRGPLTEQLDKEDQAHSTPVSARPTRPERSAWSWWCTPSLRRSHLMAR